MSRIQETLKQYTYNLNKPALTAHPLYVYDAQGKQNGLKFTIKLYKRSDSDLASYFQKIKAAASQFLIKIYEIINQPQTSQLLIIQEAAPYGTLSKALNKVKRLQQDDALNVIKQLLNGHIDLLRSGTVWSGSQGDIDITQNGIKLSWNNSMIYSQNNPNPFPDLIDRIAVRKDQSAVIPFPVNKMITDLVKVSRENASEMSLHPLLKKRDKVFKKKGKNWLAIKQFKLKGEYTQQLSYTAISKQHGIVRVKVFDKGELDPNLIKIYQTKPSFTKILEYYEEGPNFITVSQYANDGSVQSYMKRLKAANTQLKQNHIQFIFYSLIQPLKFINASPVISFNMLHIRNVYLENGIPKLGEIFPMNQTLNESLKERADVPDFYHKQFKLQPGSKDPRYDTYSLGVLLYKLMYTEYPIFPQQSVHIPTSPNYKKALKDALILFLNKGGNLMDLENELQVSDDIKNQVKMNEKILYSDTKKQGTLLVNQERQRQEYHSQLSIGEDEQKKERERQDKDCLGKLCDLINTRGKDHQGKYRKMQLSQFAFYRKCTSVFFVFSLYFFAFFLPYLIGFFNLINNTRLFFPVTVNILGQNHKFISPNYEQFNAAVSNLGTLSYVNQVSDSLSCVMDDKGIYYDFVRPQSPHWYIYLGMSFIAMGTPILNIVTILLLKSSQVGQFSIAKMLYHYYDETIDGANQSRFALSSYLFFQLWFSMCLYAFYYLFNIIFQEQHLPCFGGTDWTQLTETLLTDRMKFTLDYFLIIMGTFLMGILSFTHIYSVYSKITYNSLLNPIFIYTPIYIALFVIMRIGSFNQFVPSFISNSSGIIGKGYLNTIGYFPQILLIAEFIIEFIVNLIFYKCLDRKIEHYVLADSVNQQAGKQ